jgi:hypothetical protein
MLRDQNENYRYGGERAAWFFWPLEQIDRRVRPSAWDPLILETGGGDRRLEN